MRRISCLQAAAVISEKVESPPQLDEYVVRIEGKLRSVLAANLRAGPP
jgi:hypothetical protein